MPSAEYLDRLVLNQASLPKARQWLTWVDYHLRELPDGHGWESCMRDSLVGLHHLIAISARRLRGNPTWDISGTMTEDIECLEDQAIRLVTRLEVMRHKDGHWLVPERFDQMMHCLYGGLRQMVRLGREIDEMRAKGNINVDVLVDVKNEVASEQL